MGIFLTNVPFAHILMSMGKIQVWAYLCERCGHYWLPHHIEALQTSLKNYNETKATEEREANR